MLTGKLASGTAIRLLVLSCLVLLSQAILPGQDAGATAEGGAPNQNVNQQSLEVGTLGTNPPVDGVFDWVYFPIVMNNPRARTLFYSIDDTTIELNGLIIVGADHFAVNPCTNTDPPSPPTVGVCPELFAGPAQESMAAAAPRICPYSEGVDITKPCPAFTIGKAFRRAAEAWNLANTGWLLVEGGGPLAFPFIKVRMSRPGELGVPPRLKIGLTDTSDAENVIVIDDPAHPPGTPGGNNGVLAFFRCTFRLTDLLGGGCAMAEIVFNYNPGPSDKPKGCDILVFGVHTGCWSIDDNMNNNLIDTAPDPIISALHEIGHALRLDHETPEFAFLPNGTLTIKAVDLAIPNGNVMRASMAGGVHKTNPNALYARNPNSKVPGDKNSAKLAAENPVK